MAAGRERLGELLTMRLAVKHVGPRLAANCKTRAGARGTAKGKHPYGNNQKLSAQCISNIWISILLRKGHGGGDSPCNTCVRTAPGTQDRMRRCGDAHLPAQRERERHTEPWMRGRAASTYLPKFSGRLCVSACHMMAWNGTSTTHTEQWGRARARLTCRDVIGNDHLGDRASGCPVGHSLGGLPT